MLDRDGWKDSLCRFIHIEGPTVHFRCKRNGNRSWQLASLEDHPIHKDTTVVVYILAPEEPQLEEALASDTFRGLVLFDPGNEDVFVIVLRDFAHHSERIGNWRAKANLLIFPKVENAEGSKVSLREDRSYGSRSDAAISKDYKEITMRRKEKVRLG